MARAPLLPGFRPTKGGRRYYNITGHRSISRRQYDNLRAQQAGWANVSQMQREGKRYAPKWDKWKYRIRQANPAADVSAYSPLRFDAIDVEKRRARLSRDVLGNYSDSQDPDLVAPDGPLARILQAQGYRDSDTPWAVGDTPAGVNR